jgi:type VI secretion system secreted protein VgrG
MADARLIRFVSSGADADAFVACSFRGSEELSRPYRFEIELASTRADADLDALLGKPARLEFLRAVPATHGGRAVEPVVVHGIVSEAFQKGRIDKTWAAYRAVLVPRIWKLGLSTHSRIFLGKTAPEIVREILEVSGLTDSEFRLTAREYARREYTVQYRESDLAFLDRLCEYEGIWYRFDQGEEEEKLVFADSPEAYGAPKEYSCRPQGGTDRPEEVWSLESRRSMVPAEVALKEYNWRTPSVDLQVTAPVEAPGTTGTAYLFGEHYKTPDEGRALARVRAQELLCRRVVFEGTGDVRAFRAGSTFGLRDHFRADCNRAYLLVGVAHEASQPVEFLPAGEAYRNAFVAIPSDAEFRPARRTPLPRVDGVLAAKVDAAGSGEYAEIDDQGRYKVQIPFDRSGREGGLASRFIRMAQPYAGQDMGMHFPLHKGTEVILVHTNGDPDRPVIAGAVPNAETPSVVTGSNQTECAIQTSGGNAIRIENTKGKQKMRLYSPHKSTIFELGAP